MITDLQYCPNTGVFCWIKPKNGRTIGAEVGTVNTTGYRLICVNRKRYLAHRLAWFMYYGKWPKGDLDHINGVKDDNRVVNLRESTKSQNQCNRKSKGYSYHKGTGKYQSRITFQGKTTYLGFFDTEEDASSAYESAKQEYHKDYAYKEEK